jgi:hypothetical protein
MKLVLYRTPRFRKSLGELRKADKKGILAAEHAEEIINRLTARNDASFCGLKNKYTRNGELRLEKCRKYNLGSGYRLICLKKESTLFLLFIGSHDECDRWLNIRRKSKLVTDLKRIELIENGLAPLEEKENLLDPEEDEYEDMLYARLDDRVLRTIFKGICKRTLDPVDQQAYR